MPTSTRNRVRHFIYQAHTLNRDIRTFAINTTGQSSTAKLLLYLNETNEIVAYIQQLVFANTIPAFPASQMKMPRFVKHPQVPLRLK